MNGTAISGTSGYLTIYDCFIAGNVGVPGSAIGTCANLYGSTFSGNSTTAKGGVITTGYSTIISNCLFIGNSANMAGCIDGLCGTLIDCLFYENIPYDISSKNVKYGNCIYGSVASDTVDLSTSICTSDPRFNFGKNPKLPYYSIR